ncbi:hypothetical protein KO537_11000 [Shewanella sp. NKUCC01_JLK]|uniref:hypothetical protein n=1 Tax=Shewanella sp. NKUCC01_JLK TaxID=2842123 RepID=UPI001C5A98EF|nr:hypothetical protein [Shewanella sp. NKUCC01_JLK]MBW3515249.1 hypothetical protein [Shewanella sp. NKUCC01_JLK]
MTKSAIFSILLCAAVLVGAMYFGDWTKQPYLNDIAAEIRKASAVIEPKKPSSSGTSTAEADAERDQSPKIIWDQMAHEKPSNKPQPEALIFNQAQPKPAKTDEALSKNTPLMDSGSGATQPETVKHNKPV